MESLTRDRDRKLKLIEFEKEFLDTQSSVLLEEEEKAIEEFFKTYPGYADEE